MIKKITISLAFIICFTGLVWCSSLDKQIKNIWDTPSVVTSIPPLYAHTTAILWEKWTVTNLVNPWVSVHYREPTSNDIKALEQADAIVFNWLHLEEFLDKKKYNAIDTSKNINLIAFWDSDKTAIQEEHEGEEHNENHEEDWHEDHEHGEYDPHVRLDPRASIIQTQNILQGLTSSPSYEYFANNAKTYIQKLEQLDTEIKEQLASIEKQNFVVFHEAFWYYIARYWLQDQYKWAIKSFDGQEPSAQQIATLISTLKSNNVKIIFTEPQFSPDILTIIAEEVDWLVVKQIDPLWKTLSPNWYIENMKDITQQFISAFEQVYEDKNT